MKENNLPDIILDNLQTLKHTLETLNKMIGTKEQIPDRLQEIYDIVDDMRQRTRPEIVLKENKTGHLIAYGHYQAEILTVELGKASEYRYLKQEEVEEIARFRMIKMYNKRYPFHYFA